MIAQADFRWFSGDFFAWSYPLRDRLHGFPFFDVPPGPWSPFASEPATTAVAADHELRLCAA